MHAKDIFQKVIREKVRRQLKTLDPEVNVNDVVKKDDSVDVWQQKVQTYATDCKEKKRNTVSAI